MATTKKKKKRTFAEKVEKRGFDADEMGGAYVRIGKSSESDAIVLQVVYEDGSVNEVKVLSYVWERLEKYGIEVDSDTK